MMNGGLKMIDYRIRPKEGYDEKIGELVSMLEHSREVTLNELTNLNQKELDFLVGDNSNSIGSLLLHIASIEFVHQVITFEKRDLNESEYLEWQTALELGEKARNGIKNQPIEYYIEKLSSVRRNTLELLKLKSDNWLFEENQWDNGVPFNNYYLWFHVMEDEINHRGQIRMIKRINTK
jgi:uncharacterized damage-inducible protein DinB